MSAVPASAPSISQLHPKYPGTAALARWKPIRTEWDMAHECRPLVHKFGFCNMCIQHTVLQPLLQKEPTDVSHAENAGHQDTVVHLQVLYQHPNLAGDLHGHHRNPEFLRLAVDHLHSAASTLIVNRDKDNPRMGR